MNGSIVINTNKSWKIKAKDPRFFSRLLYGLNYVFSIEIQIKGD